MFLKIAVLLSLFSHTLYAAPEVDAVFAGTSCLPSPALKLDQEPKHIAISNNLRHTPGSFDKNLHNNIVITGRIFDKNCVPISDAIIQIWHHATSKSSKGFVGSGSSSSDNQGRFQFITIMPPKTGHSAPYINVLIKHRDLKTLRTKILFEDEQQINHHSFSGLNQDQIKRITATKIDLLKPTEDGFDYNIDLVVDQDIKNKRY